MTPARFRWGLLLIQIGILLLLRNTGVINDNFWVDLLIFFPLVLILVGIEKIFTKSKMQFIAYGTSVILFASGFVIATTGSQHDGFESGFFTESSFTEKYSQDFTKIEAVLNVDETDVVIRDSGRDLLRGDFDKFTRKPKIVTDYTTDIARISLTRRENSFLGGAVRINTDEPQDWHLKFSDTLPLDLTCNGDRSDLHFNFSTTPLENLALNADDAIIYLKIGDLMPEVTIDVRGDNSSLKLRLPSHISIQVGNDYYRSYFETLGLIEKDSGLYIIDSLTEINSNIKIDMDDRLRSFSIDYF